ncbi:hypothetical protein SBRCBS47491_004031 [Sporothrix bragantina]|uniref:Xylanolytic transcriptional activator regulatory domain-containing protein n=1 Tax=Sporothrix bragantina TaxID=671064 RepID=A0ABP0BKC7_9PEZI
MLPDRTCLYSGASSDQDPHLLRHLTYDETGCFGGAGHVPSSSSPRSTRPGRPSYLTVFPNPHLDCLADMYSQEQVEALFAPHQDELVRLYYEHVHPSYPILEPMDDILLLRQAKRIPSSLLAIIYKHGAQFWHLSPRAAEASLAHCSAKFATLLIMQMLPRQIRASNHPGFWPMTNMLVGMAQDIGLHVDPAQWHQLTSSERKMRRVLWWAVLTHDKWMAHSLGRPSHISAAGHGGWDVAPLTLEDFSDDAGWLPVSAVSSASSFVALLGRPRSGGPNAEEDPTGTASILSYLRGHMAMVGSLLITLVLASVDDETLDERRDLLLTYRRYLVTPGQPPEDAMLLWAP